MATGPVPSTTGDDQQPAAHHAFGDQIRLQLANDDSIALRNVSILLFAIVMLGLLLGVIAVLIAT